METPREYSVQVRFYKELNDFVKQYPPGEIIFHRFRGKRSIKDLIESFGVPHTEVDLILVNRDSVGFDYIVRSGDSISVYPVFERFNIQGLSKLRDIPLRESRFVLDVHLGKLSRLLRLLGFNTDYDRFRDDPELAEISQRQKRILLTCDRRLLMRKIVDRGMIIRDHSPLRQAGEVLNKLDLWDRIALFSRCIRCNGNLYPVPQGTEEFERVIRSVPPGVSSWCTAYVRCNQCRKIYWRGSHFDHMDPMIRQLYTLRESQDRPG